MYLCIHYCGCLVQQDRVVWVVRVRMQHVEDSNAFRILAKVSLRTATQ